MSSNKSSSFFRENYTALYEERGNLHDSIHDFITYFGLTYRNYRCYGQRDRSDRYSAIWRRHSVYIHNRMGYETSIQKKEEMSSNKSSSFFFSRFLQGVL